MSNFDFSSSRARLFALLVITASILTAGESFATDASREEASETESRRLKSLHPHCGLYCVYTLLELANQKVDFKDLVKPEYIGSSKGSSMAELKDAAEDHGLYVVPADKLSSRELQSSPCPIILHVKSDVGAQEYDHYELFLGAENGKVKLFNPPEPVRWVPYSQIARRWDGIRKQPLVFQEMPASCFIAKAQAASLQRSWRSGSRMRAIPIFPYSEAAGLNGWPVTAGPGRRRYETRPNNQTETGGRLCTGRADSSRMHVPLQQSSEDTAAL